MQTVVQHRRHQDSNPSTAVVFKRGCHETSSSSPSSSHTGGGDTTLLLLVPLLLLLLSCRLTTDRY
jgi:hypothetical protein